MVAQTEKRQFPISFLASEVGIHGRKCHEPTPTPTLEYWISSGCWIDAIRGLDVKSRLVINALLE